MPKIDGYSKYTCDRNSAHTAYARDDGPESEGWYVIKRVDKNGNIMERLLCNKCYEDYQIFAASADDEFTAFMKGQI